MKFQKTRHSAIALQNSNRGNYSKFNTTPYSLSHFFTSFPHLKVYSLASITFITFFLPSSTSHFFEQSECSVAESHNFNSSEVVQLGIIDDNSYVVADMSKKDGP